MEKCIICLENGKLIKVCKCNYYLHKDCLNLWINKTNNNKCLICDKKVIKDSYCILIKKYIYIVINFLKFCLNYDLYSGLSWDVLTN